MKAESAVAHQGLEIYFLFLFLPWEKEECLHWGRGGEGGAPSRSLLLGTTRTSPCELCYPALRICKQVQVATRPTRPVKRVAKKKLKKMLLNLKNWESVSHALCTSKTDFVSSVNSPGKIISRYIKLVKSLRLFELAHRTTRDVSPVNKQRLEKAALAATLRSPTAPRKLAMTIERSSSLANHRGQ